jgi:MFS family permease
MRTARIRTVEERSNKSGRNTTTRDVSSKRTKQKATGYFSYLYHSISINISIHTTTQHYYIRSKEPLHCIIMAPEYQEPMEEPLLDSYNDEDIISLDTCHDDDDDDPSKNITIPYLNYGQPLVMNHNVLLNLVICLLYGLSDSLWNGTANAAYLKQLGHDQNGPLGDIEAVNGLASLLTALPIGYLADRIGRSKVIRAGGVLMFLTIGVQIYLLEWIGTHSPEANSREHNLTALIIMGVVMACWGVADGVVNGPASALYADSTPQGQRSAYYTYLFACYMLASSVGPLVSIILFETLGDEWDFYHLRLVMYVGLGIASLQSILMVFFDDSKALEEDPEHTVTTASQLDADTTDAVPEPLPLVSDEEEPATTTTTTATTTIPQGPWMTRHCQRWIPYIIFVQGLILAIGSGMTVKFFPLFFKDEVGFTPSQVQMVYICVPITMVIMSGLISKLASTGFGRVQATLVFSGFGISMLYAMVFFKTYLDDHPLLLVPIYVLRTSLMNCSYPLQESILMDFVPKHERARWKSLDSVAGFGWCGSAMLGGWLSDRFDYTYTFLITAIIQTVGTGVFALLLPLVPRVEGGNSSPDASSLQVQVQGGSQEDSNEDSVAVDMDMDMDPTTTTDDAMSIESSSSSRLQEPLLRRRQRVGAEPQDEIR